MSDEAEKIMDFKISSKAPHSPIVKKQQNSGEILCIFFMFSLCTVVVYSRLLSACSLPTFAIGQDFIWFKKTYAVVAKILLYKLEMPLNCQLLLKNVGEVMHLNK